MMFFTIPFTKGSASNMTGDQEETKAKENKTLPPAKRQKVRASVDKEASPLKNPHDIIGYSGPQWGLRGKEIEYLFENSKDFLCIIEFGQHFIRLNKTWKQFLGWEIEELLDVPYINFVHPEDIQKTLEYEKEFTPGGLINRYRCKDGSYRWLDWIGLSRTSGEEMSEGKNYLLSIARDITLQKILESQFQEKTKKISENKWYEDQRILEVITEIQGSHISSVFNKNEENTANCTLEVTLQNLINLSESKGGFIGEIASTSSGKLAVHYRWGKSLLSKKQEVGALSRSEETRRLEDVFTAFASNTFLKTKEPLIIDNMSNYPKGIEIPTEVTQLKSFLGIPLITHDKPIGIIGLFNSIKGYNKHLLKRLDPIFLLSGHILNDIKMHANQKGAAEETLARKQADAENSAKSSFLAHMSHEIRTPLTGLLGTLGLINKGDLQEEDLKYLQIAHGCGLSLLSILNDILDISKIDAGQLKLECVRFNPIIIAQEVVQLLALEAEKKGVDITLTTGSKVPLYLMGDPTRLRQIFFNLICNAIKFTHKGSVGVFLDGTYDSSHFKLIGSVKDTGIGISHEAQERLFMSFSQSDSSIMRRFGGTGLGLFITKQLCEIMGGSVSVLTENLSGKSSF